MTSLDLGINLTSAPIPGAGSPVMSFTGVAPNTVRTPDQAAFDMSAGLEVTAIDVAPADRNTVRSVVARRTEAGDNRSWTMDVQASGALSMTTYAADGATALASFSAVAPWVANSEKLSLRYRYLGDDGGGNHVTTYWYSTDQGQNWTLLSTDTVAGVRPINDVTTFLEIGGFNSGYSNIFAGTIRSMLLTDLSAVAVAEADPSSVADPYGGSWVSPTTGETWTASGNASIIDL